MHTLQEKSPKTASLSFLKEANRSLGDLMNTLSKNESKKLDRHPEKEYQKEICSLAKQLIRSMADFYGIKRDPFLQNSYRVFISEVFKSLKTLMFFIYSDKFRNSERTKKAIQWYWDKMKSDMINAVTSIIDHYEKGIETEVLATEYVPVKKEATSSDTCQNELQEPSENMETAISPDDTTIDFQEEKKKRKNRKQDTPVQLNLFDQQFKHIGKDRSAIPANNVSTPNEQKQKVIVADLDTGEQNPEPTPVTGIENYTLNGTELEGGIKTKLANNINAVKLLKELEQQSRRGSDSERAVLSKYCGWGGMPQVFGAAGAEWDRSRDEIKNLLSEEEYQQARASTLNSFYTPT